MCKKNIFVPFFVEWRDRNERKFCSVSDWSINEAIFLHFLFTAFTLGCLMTLSFRIDYEVSFNCCLLKKNRINDFNLMSKINFILIFHILPLIFPLDLERTRLVMRVKSLSVKPHAIRKTLQIYSWASCVERRREMKY